MRKNYKNLNEVWFGICDRLIIDGKEFDEENNILSTTIENKHRVQVVYGNQTNDDISISIRLKRNSKVRLKNFHFTKNDKITLVRAVKNKQTILISGGTGSGKTSLLNSLIRFIDPEERIITIENAREIEIDPLIHKNHDALIYLEDKVEKISDLLNATLRMRPDRIIIGELRNENSYVFLRACNTGHEGTLSTIHANNPKGAIAALVQNIQTTGNKNYDSKKIEQEILRNINLIVQLKRKRIAGKVVIQGYLKEVKNAVLQ